MSEHAKEIRKRLFRTVLSALGFRFAHHKVFGECCVVPEIHIFSKQLNLKAKMLVRSREDFRRWNLVLVNYFFPPESAMVSY